jgi:hypothetical protein
MNDIETLLAAELSVYQSDTTLNSGWKEFVGVVGPSGVAGVGSSGPGQWTMAFSFEDWREAGHPVCTATVRVEKEVSEFVLRSYMGAIDAYSVIRVCGRLVNDGERNTLEMKYLLGVNEVDAELKALAHELQKPVERKSAIFGRMILDRRVNWFEGKAIWHDSEVRIALDMDDAESFESVEGIAAGVWQIHGRWQRELEEVAVRELLSVKNESWLEDGEGPISRDEFLARMKLESVTVRADGTVEFWHEDGDLFWGHMIKVEGNVREGCKWAGIEG